MNRFNDLYQLLSTVLIVEINKNNKYMNKTPYRLKLWASFEKENRFITLFLDMNSITGFYIPEKDEESDDSSKTINLLFGAEVITVMQESHLVEFLKETFINNAKTKE